MVIFLALQFWEPLCGVGYLVPLSYNTRFHLSSPYGGIPMPESDINQAIAGRLCYLTLMIKIPESVYRTPGIDSFISHAQKLLLSGTLFLCLYQKNILSTWTVALNKFNYWRNSLSLPKYFYSDFTFRITSSTVPSLYSTTPTILSVVCMGLGIPVSFSAVFCR